MSKPHVNMARSLSNVRR